MSGDTLQSQVNEIRSLMETRLRIRGKTLEAQVRKAGRLLPRNVRREATYLAHAATIMMHPKLVRMVDGAKATQAHARLVYFLNSVDPNDRAKGMLLNWLGAVAFIILVTFIAVVFVLVQRGIV